MKKDRIVRQIDDKFVSMIPGETKELGLLDKCNGCVFDGMTACDEAYNNHQINGVAYCGHFESVWRLSPAEVYKKERRKLNGI